MTVKIIFAAASLYRAAFLEEDKQPWGTCGGPWRRYDDVAVSTRVHVYMGMHVQV